MLSRYRQQPAGEPTPQQGDSTMAMATPKTRIFYLVDLVHVKPCSFRFSNIFNAEATSRFIRFLHIFICRQRHADRELLQAILVNRANNGVRRNHIRKKEVRFSSRLNELCSRLPDYGSGLRSRSGRNDGAEKGKTRKERKIGRRCCYGYCRRSRPSSATEHKTPARVFAHTLYWVLQ